MGGHPSVFGCPLLSSSTASSVDRLLNGNRGLVGLLAVAFGRLGVLLGSVVLALLMMVGSLEVMMRSHLVMRSRLKVLVDCLGLIVGRHDVLLRELCLADREATLPPGGRLVGTN